MRALFVATIILLAGCTSPEPQAAPDIAGEDPVPAEGILTEAAYSNFTGTLRSLPGMAGTVSGEVMVLPNTGRITATLLWSDPLADLALTFVAQNASGEQHSGGTYDAPGAGRVAADIPAPATGAWTYTITGSNALDVAWDLIIFVAPDDAVTTVISESFFLAAGAFFEINTQMEDGASMSWAWTIAEESTSDFNVHSHFDGEAQYLVVESTTAHTGRIDVNRTGGYSLMWENPGAVPQTIQYRAWGDFAVDSYFPPR